MAAQSSVPFPLTRPQALALHCLETLLPHHRVRPLALVLHQQRPHPTRSHPRNQQLNQSLSPLVAALLHRRKLALHSALVLRRRQRRHQQLELSALTSRHRHRRLHLLPRRFRLVARRQVRTHLDSLQQRVPRLEARRRLLKTRLADSTRRRRRRQAFPLAYRSLLLQRRAPPTFPLLADLVLAVDLGRLLLSRLRRSVHRNHWRPRPRTTRSSLLVLHPSKATE